MADGGEKKQTHIFAVQGSPPELVRQAADVLEKLYVGVRADNYEVTEMLLILHAARGMLEPVIEQLETYLGKPLYSGPTLPKEQP